MNRLLVTTTASTPHGQVLIESVDNLVRARQGVDRLLSAIQQMIYGSPADYEQMRAELGMDTAQHANDLASLLTLAQEKLNDPLLDQFIARCDQGG